MAGVLQKGDRGSEVKLCQELLAQHGLVTAIDGVFGNGTEASVKQFQQRENLSVDGIVGAATWGRLESSAPTKPIDWKELVSLLPEFLEQKYQLSQAQCPSNPPGVTLKRLGYETTNCVQFTAWLLSSSFPSAMFRGDQWSEWMVSGSVPSGVTPVPGYGPRVVMEWGYATTAPGKGPWLVQYFTGTTGHSLIIVAHDPKTDKILTLEAVGSLGGVGWGELGALRDTFNPGPSWVERVTQTWSSRLGSKVAVHVVQLAISSESVQNWLQEGV